MRSLLIVLSLLLASCAARQPSPQLVAELGRADMLVRDGCHQCLSEALQIYERAAVQRNAPREAARGAFTAAVLLAMRAKELGMPDESSIATARAWATQQPPPSRQTQRAELPPEVYLEALDLFVGELSGLLHEERERKNRDRRAAWPSDEGQLPAVRHALAPVLAYNVMAQYLATAIDCEEARVRKTVNHEELLARHPYPLMRFRLGLCGIAGVRLDPLRAADARWTDTLFFEGRHEMTRFPTPDVGRAAELLTLGYEAFPTSVAIALALGNARNALEEHAGALELFDSILTALPTHRDALLGRLLALSYMKRHYDAIRTATRMVELGTYNTGDAYYWRAWNRYQVHELPSAWVDVEEARKLMVNTAVYTLAGFIAYAQRELDVAIDRLDRAYRLDASNCEAVWTEGMVHVDKQAWPLSAARFTTAIGCFEKDAAAAREAIVMTQNSSLGDALKARRIATAQKRADSSEHRRAQAAFNAASSYARLANKAEALKLLEIATEHPLLKEKAASLRANVEKLP